MNNLKFLLSKHGWTQKQLARMLGVGEGEISRLCNGWYARCPERWQVEFRRIFGDEWTFERLMAQAGLRNDPGTRKQG